MEKDDANSTSRVGNIGANARVQVGTGNRSIESSSQLGTAQQAVIQQLDDLLARITTDSSLESVSRVLSLRKVHALKDAVIASAEKPECLQLTLLDSKVWLSASATHIWKGIQAIFESDVGNKVISGIAEGTAKAAIAALLEN